MTKQEFDKYRNEIEDQYGECTVLVSKFKQKAKNANGTSNRIAYKSISWIEYWQAMTCNYDHVLYCGSCNKEIFVGNPTSSDLEKFKENVDSHKAYGGHIWINAPKDADYRGGRYIIPLCPQCNAKHDIEINIREGVKCCKELGAITK